MHFHIGSKVPLRSKSANTSGKLIEMSATPRKQDRAITIPASSWISFARIYFLNANYIGNLVRYF